MRTAFGLRLLLALTLMGWGQFVFAEDYQWTTGGYAPSRASSASASCTIFANWYPNATSPSVRNIGDGDLRCVIVNGINWREEFYTISRSGDSCPEPGSVLNAQAGECSPPPNACEPLAGQRFSFFANVPNGGSSLPGEYICNQGCRAAWSGECGTNDQGVSACWGLATYNGQVCESGDTPSGIGTPPKDPSEPTDPTTPTDPTEPTDPTDPPPTCGPGYSWSGTTCVKDPPKVCDPSTGEVCPPTDPTGPTNPTDPTDPNNPGDGGDGDGSGDGDGEPGTPGGDGDGDKEKLGPKIDKTNSLLDGISKALGNLGDAFKEFAEDVLGEKYDGEGEGDESSIGEAAAGLAGNLAGAFGQGMTDTLAAQEASDISTLSDISNIVNNEWFGPGTAAYKAIYLIDGVLPRSTSCSPFDIKIDADRLHTNLRLDACELSRIKPLLEWIIWMLTLIGVWRIAYAGLRLENAKAEKGGF
ncbi:hypothetical protein QYS36_03860 [Pseudomonas sp. G34]|uniref:hypothetical protein n=1 Tax=Pseudomonas sp. G34 TaxID=3059083 RepID=UPI002809EA59|nr:hypothetical protein [Pseudomonas sp. G34]MDQ7984072.1 hypothetical protein [Pseudomonas sp. G34]